MNLSPSKIAPQLSAACTIFSVFVCLFFFISKSYAQGTYEEKHIKVSLRMIGHELLLNSNDSTSRVLPIIQKNNQYKIQFESEFEFQPEDLVATVNRIAKETKLGKGYIVEMEKCETREVVYSYEMEELQESNIIPCKERDQPKGCYSLLFTLIDSSATALASDSLSITVANQSQTGTSPINYIAIALLLALIAAISFFLWRRRNKSAINPNLIPLGGYYFDKINTELLIEDQKIDLTNKEADLLLLLYGAVNTTVEREVILNMVWGDEGDYVGRTLDVFISKLRKKLQADSSIKIVNTRGVGYKLVLQA
jgi:LPXTG-motif cell wall-anchored protein